MALFGSYGGNPLGFMGLGHIIMGNVLGGSFETIMVYDPSAFERASEGGFGGFISLAGNVLGWDNRLFRFRINPQTFEQSESKIRTFNKTTRGWTTSYGGENMITLSFNGTSGYMLPPHFIRDTLGIDDTRFSLAYWNLTRFQEFYQDIDRKGKVVHLVFWGNTYVGHMTQFSYGLNANDPFQVGYSFQFQAYPDKVVSYKDILPDFILNMLNMGETVATFSDQWGRR